MNLPPTYKQVARTINRLRSAASPCPLDQIPVLALKKCPILRTVLHKLITQCWMQKDIPQCWKKAMTILIYKKGDATDPANFRPITLQPVMYKILSAIYRDRIYKYLTANKYLDTEIQKGFWPGRDGLAEHSELLTHIMRDAKLHQRAISIAALDLRNAFGEIDHRLIEVSLKEYHIQNQLSSFLQTYTKTRKW